MMMDKNGVDGMAVAEFDFYSDALKRETSFSVCIPNDVTAEQKKQYAKAYSREMKTLYLLHGYGRNHHTWLLNSRITELSIQYNLAVVFPDGENSFYVDRPGAGNEYCRFVGQELVDYTRRMFGLSHKCEDSFIGGLSMGGYGALHVGLAYSDTFGKIFALSSALIIHDIQGIPSSHQDAIADYTYYAEKFGNLDQVAASLYNPERQLEKIQAEDGTLPELYVACGTEDFLIEQNRTFALFLESKEIPVTYLESPGIHDWEFWNEYLEPSLKWLMGNN